MSSTKPLQSLSFSGHESFPLRFRWLTKAVRGVSSDPALFARDDAVVRLGVGKNMVRAIRHWATRADLIRPSAKNARSGHYYATQMGKRFFSDSGIDPYLEDPATTWLVHWQLTSRRRTIERSKNSNVAEVLSPTTWIYMFNELRESCFTVESALRGLSSFAEQCGGKRPSIGTLERDLSCFIRSYTPAEPDKRLSREDTYDSPLADLGFMSRESETGRILFDRHPRPTLPISVFAYALFDFWSREYPSSDTLAFQRLAYAPGSPGQVFKLSENACVEYLESIADHTSGNVSYDTTAGLRQLIRHSVLEDPLLLFMKLHAKHTAGGKSNAA